jgi:hypothetical protein
MPPFRLKCMPHVEDEAGAVEGFQSMSSLGHCPRSLPGIRGDRVPLATPPSPASQGEADIEDGHCGPTGVLDLDHRDFDVPATSVGGAAGKAFPRICRRQPGLVVNPRAELDPDPAALQPVLQEVPERHEDADGERDLGSRYIRHKRSLGLRRDQHSAG